MMKKEHWTTNYVENSAFMKDIGTLGSASVAKTIISMIVAGCDDWNACDDAKASFAEAFKQLARLSEGGELSKAEKQAVKYGGGTPATGFMFQSVTGQDGMIEISPTGKGNTDRFYFKVGKETIEFTSVGHARGK